MTTTIRRERDNKGNITFKRYEDGKLKAETTFKKSEQLKPEAFSLKNYSSNVASRKAEAVESEIKQAPTEEAKAQIIVEKEPVLQSAQELAETTNIDTARKIYEQRVAYQEFLKNKPVPLASSTPEGLPKVAVYDDEAQQSILASQFESAAILQKEKEVAAKNAVSYLVPSKIPFKEDNLQVSRTKFFSRESATPEQVKSQISSVEFQNIINEEEGFTGYKSDVSKIKGYVEGVKSFIKNPPTPKEIYLGFKETFVTGESAKSFKSALASKDKAFIESQLNPQTYTPIEIGKSIASAPLTFIAENLLFAKGLKIIGKAISKVTPKSDVVFEGVKSDTVRVIAPDNNFFEVSSFKGQIKQAKGVVEVDAAAVVRGVADKTKGDIYFYGESGIQTSSGLKAKASLIGKSAETSKGVFDTTVGQKVITDKGKVFESAIFSKSQSVKTPEGLFVSRSVATEFDVASQKIKVSPTEAAIDRALAGDLNIRFTRPFTSWAAGEFDSVTLGIKVKPSSNVAWIDKVVKHELQHLTDKIKGRANINLLGLPNKFPVSDFRYALTNTNELRATIAERLPSKSFVKQQVFTPKKVSLSGTQEILRLEEGNFVIQKLKSADVSIGGVGGVSKFKDFSDFLGETEVSSKMTTGTGNFWSLINDTGDFLKFKSEFQQSSVSSLALDSSIKNVLASPSISLKPLNFPIVSSKSNNFKNVVGNVEVQKSFPVLQSKPVVSSKLVGSSSKLILAPKLVDVGKLTLGPSVSKSEIFLNSIVSDKFKSSNILQDKIISGLKSFSEISLSQSQFLSQSQSVSQVQRLSQSQSLSQSQRLSQFLKLNLKTTPKITQIQIPKNSLGVSSSFASKGLKSRLFEVFVKVKGKDVKFGSFKDLGEAKSSLYFRLTTSLGASGFVKEKGKGFVPVEELGFGSRFRRSKVDAFRVVQKRSARLSSRSEVSLIQKAKKSGFFNSKKSVKGGFL